MEFDPKEATKTECREYTKWRIQIYKRRMAWKDYPVQELFEEDFEAWTVDQLQKAGKDALDALRSTLREAQVYVKKQPGYKVAKALYEVITEALYKAIINLEDWPRPITLVLSIIFARLTLAEALTKREPLLLPLPSLSPLLYELLSCELPAAALPDRLTTATLARAT